MIALMIAIMFVVIGCSKETGEQEKTDEKETESSATIEQTEQVDKEQAPTEQSTIGEDITIEGTLTVDQTTMTIDAKSNLLEGTVVKATRYMEPFRNRLIMGMLDNFDGVVEADGSFQIELDRPSEFSDGKYIEIALEVLPGSQSDEITALYGKNGENLTGAPVYQREEYDGTQTNYIYVPIFVLLEGEESKMEFSAPEREELPADYGDPEVWIEYELTNDHRFYYVKGKTNLMEGTIITGGYFSSPNAITPQYTYMNKTKVEPDGTFLLRISYSSMREEGYIKVESTSSSGHNLKKSMAEQYGENFKKMTGEHVVKDKNGNKIYFELHPDGPEIDVSEDVNLTTDEEEVKVAMPDDVLFDYDSSELKAESASTLDNVIAILEKLEDGSTIHINGHTDNQGNADYNLTLSEKRAKAVEAYLTKQGNLSHLTISTKGYGETKPLESNDDESGRQKNRRVEVVINPKEDAQGQ